MWSSPAVKNKMTAGDLEEDRTVTTLECYDGELRRHCDRRSWIKELRLNGEDGWEG
jgi:hypothetical protein